MLKTGSKLYEHLKAHMVFRTSRAEFNTFLDDGYLIVVKRQISYSLIGMEHFL